VPIHVALHHLTEYRYDRLVHLSPQLVRLRPAPHCRTPILSYSLLVEPPLHFINWQQDPQSNYVARLTFPERVDAMRIEVDLVAETAVYLEVGSRSPDDIITCSDVDMTSPSSDGRFLHKDGTPYPGQ